MKGGVLAEGEFAEIPFLHLDEVLFVFGAQTLENGWMDDNHELEARSGGSFFGRFQITFRVRVFRVLAAFMRPVIAARGARGFRCVHENMAAALEMHLAREGGFELARDGEAIENRLRFRIEFD